jgi:uncharacterized protein
MTVAAIISDSHGREEYIPLLLEKHPPVDIVIHCGDGAGDISLLHSHPSYSDIQVVQVLGNVDTVSGIGEEEYITVESTTLLVVHGHRFGVKEGLNRLWEYAIERGADIAFFGHTHIPHREGKAPLLFNPGSLFDGYYGLAHFHPGQYSIQHYRLDEM